MDENTLVCPYCGMEQRTHEPDEISSNLCWEECEHCGKHFWYNVTVTRYYSSYTDDEDGEDGDNDNW